MRLITKPDSWSNWSGRQSASPRLVGQPEHEADFSTLVTAAREQGLTVRAVGASHSHSRVAAPDGALAVTDGWQGLIDVDTDHQQATFRSGTRIFQTGPLLHPHGLALRNQGDIDKQSLAGATATGTHGTGPALQNLSASIRRLRIVLASGEIVECSHDDNPEVFEVARLSLGGVGLVTGLTLDLRACYRLHERVWLEHPDTVMPRIDELVAATRHFEFFWMPERDRCAVKTLTETDAVALPASADPRRERLGWSHEIISSIRDERHTEMEYAVPAERGPACFVELRAMIQQHFPELTWPLEYRTLAADDLWLSPASHRPTVTISAHQDITLDDRPLFEACEEIFRRHDGRPHWGKVHSCTGDELAQMYPQYRAWWAVRDRLDPDGVFVTADLSAVRPTTQPDRSDAHV
ncbi:MAG: FAD-binding protein [Actinomycetota bacterium]|nr:FAD-binding protein [Actinomycetota bacterium]